MSSHTARIAVLPRELATEVITSAVSRAGWAVAVALLLINAVVVVDTVSRRTAIENSVLPLLATAGMLGLLAFVGFAPSALSRWSFVAGGAVLATAYQVALLVADPAINEQVTHLVNRPAFVLVIGCAGVVRPLVGLALAVVGYVAAMASLVVGALLVGVAPAPGWGPTVALAIYASVCLTLAGIRASQSARVPDLQRLENDTRRMALEHQYEQRAAAIIHDTVLNDLSAVMNTDGPLHERARDRFHADVATLADASWLRESRDDLTLDPHDSTLRSGMVALASEVQWRGLTVEVTGNPENAVVRLSPAKIEAIHAAVRACLENVVRHSGVTTAELVLGASDDSATIMVIDRGVGFDVGAVAADRLGLRSSIIRRVEEFGGSVTVWSTPGSGTSVDITMPCDVAPEQVRHVE